MMLSKFEQERVEFLISQAEKGTYVCVGKSDAAILRSLLEDSDSLMRKIGKNLFESTNKKEVNDDLVFRLRKRAEIRRQIPNRKSVVNNERDRIADLLEEAALALENT